MEAQKLIRGYIEPHQLHDDEMVDILRKHTLMMYVTLLLIDYAALTRPLALGTIFQRI